MATSQMAVKELRWCWAHPCSKYEEQKSYFPCHGYQKYRIVVYVQPRCICASRLQLGELQLQAITRKLVYGCGVFLCFVCLVVSVLGFVLFWGFLFLFWFFFVGLGFFVCFVVLLCFFFKKTNLMKWGLTSAYLDYSEHEAYWKLGCRKRLMKWLFLHPVDVAWWLQISV